MGSGPMFIHYLVTRAKRKSGTTSTTELVKKKSSPFSQRRFNCYSGNIEVCESKIAAFTCVSVYPE